MTSTGIDIESISRLKGLASNPRFLQRVFRKAELYCTLNKRTPQKHLAGRFAAKEACMKAIGTGLSKGVKWTDIEVVKGLGGRPGIRLHSKARELVPAGKRVFLSIAYSRDLATALVVIE